MQEFINSIDWNSFFVGVAATLLLGGGGAFLFALIFGDGDII
ncbi:hypothetical protein [Paenibacillus donghaensis]|nr:hypothetical protein [Paenibacillus donghaensis]